MSDERDPRSILAAEIMNTIVASAGGDPEGSEHVGVDPTVVRQALVVCMAALLEVDPDMQTTKQMREARDLVGRELMMQMQTFRQEFERSGRRVWVAASVALN